MYMMLIMCNVKGVAGSDVQNYHLTVFLLSMTPFGAFQFVVLVWQPATLLFGSQLSYE